MKHHIMVSLHAYLCAFQLWLAMVIKIIKGALDHEQMIYLGIKCRYLAWHSNVNNACISTLIGNCDQDYKKSIGPQASDLFGDQM